MAKETKHLLKVGLAAPFVMALLVIFGMIVLVLS